MMIHGWKKRVSLSLKRRDYRTLFILLLLLTLLTSAWVALVASSASYSAAASSRLPGSNSTNAVDASAGDSQHQQQEQQEHQQDKVTLDIRPVDRSDSDRVKGSLERIVFGIAGSAKLWPARKEMVRLWWKPQQMRGFVWHEDPVQPQEWDPSLPPIRISEDTSSFRYTNVDGYPAGIRIARIVLETMRLNLTGVDWLVLCDDDTVFSVDNLVRVLANYNASQMFYIGSVSESHVQNVAFSHKMAFGGGGIALSFPLAEELAGMQDGCLQHYPQLTGSDDRLYACISELGVPLTREPGFHQMDIRGNPLGLLSAHPVAPFVSMHHMEAMDPVFPEQTRMESLRLLMKAMSADSTNFLQQSIGYDRSNRLTFSISTGYVVQVYQQLVFPRVLEKAEITFKAWSSRTGPVEFDLDTRKVSIAPQYLFFLNNTYVEKSSSGSSNRVVSEYKLYNPPADKDCSKHYCWSKMLLSGSGGNRGDARSLGFQTVLVVTTPLSSGWYKVPRRQCCHFGKVVDGAISVTISPCEPGETLVKV